MRIRVLACAAAALTLGSMLSPLVRSEAAPARDDVATCTEVFAVPEVGSRACKSVEQVAASAAQFCRSADGDPESCATFNGEVASAEAVAAHEASPLAEQIRQLHAVEITRPLLDARLIATHNSYNAASEFPTVSGMDANQTYDLTDQLRLGARMVELDIKWLPSPYGDPSNGFETATLCHGAGNAGCSWDRPLADGLAEISAFVDEHPGEVVLIDIRDTTAPDAQAKAFIVDAFEAAFPGSIWTTDDSVTATGSGAFPLALSLADIGAAGKQVLLVGTDLDSPIVHGDDRRQSNTPLDYQIGDCASTVAVHTATHWTRYWEDTTWLAAMAGSTGTITPEIAADQFRCGINAISLDHLVPGDPRLAAIADAWAEEIAAT